MIHMYTIRTGVCFDTNSWSQIYVYVTGIRPQWKPYTTKKNYATEQ